MRRAVSWLCGVIAAGCAGVAPDPAAMEADVPASPPGVDAVAADRAVEAALRQLSAGDVAAARAAVDAVLRDDPGHARGRAALAQCLMAEARAERPPTLALWRRAEGELRRASRIAPADPVVARTHAGFLVEDGHLTAAAERIDETLRVAPADAELLELGGRVRFDLGDERAAIRLLERRLTLVPEDAASTWRLAQCEARLADAEFESGERRRREDAAIAAFARYGVLAPDDADGPLAEAHLRIRHLSATGDADEFATVLTLFDAVERLRPTSPDSAFGRGVAFDAVGRGGSAVPAYEAALALDPQHVPSLLNLAADLAAAGDRAAARPLLERALAVGVTADERARIAAFLASDG